MRISSGEGLERRICGYRRLGQPAVGLLPGCAFSTRCSGILGYSARHPQRRSYRASFKARQCAGHVKRLAGSPCHYRRTDHNCNPSTLPSRKSEFRPMADADNPRPCCNPLRSRTCSDYCIPRLEHEPLIAARGQASSSLGDTMDSGWPVVNIDLDRFKLLVAPLLPPAGKAAFIMRRGATHHSDTGSASAHFQASSAATGLRPRNRLRNHVIPADRPSSHRRHSSTGQGRPRTCSKALAPFGPDARRGPAVSASTFSRSPCPWPLGTGKAGPANSCAGLERPVRRHRTQAAMIEDSSISALMTCRIPSARVVEGKRSAGGHACSSRCLPSITIPEMAAAL